MHPSAHNTRSDALLHVGAGRTISRRSAFPFPEAGLSRADRTAGPHRNPQRIRRPPPLAGRESNRSQPASRDRRTFPQQRRTASRRPDVAGHCRGPRHPRRHAGRQRLSTGLPAATGGPPPGLPDSRAHRCRSDAGDARDGTDDRGRRSRTDGHHLDAAGDASPHGCFPYHEHVRGHRVQHQPVRAAAGFDGDLQHRQLRRRPSHARSGHPAGGWRSAAQRARR